MPASHVFLRSVQISRVLTRSVFTARKPDYTHPNWLRVGLAFGCTIALWVQLFNQHEHDVQEYKAHHGIK